MKRDVLCFVIGVVLVVAGFALVGCASTTTLMGKALDASQQVVTKGLEKLDTVQVAGGGHGTMYEPGLKGYAEVYQAWGFRWEVTTTGASASGQFSVAGAGEGSR